MILATCLSATIIVLMVIVLLPKNMLINELIFNFMIVVYLHIVVFGIISANLNLISVSTDSEKAISYMFIRFILYPVLILFFLQIYLKLHTFLVKIFAAFACALILAFIDAALRSVGILIFTNWQITGLIAAWFVFLLVCLLIMKGFRHLTEKEVYPR
ncbi:hypothetical protein ACFQZT_09890 [Paenibacillus sp. GCM10027628]|uniref:hypothetical protein n=1 Tax=Paenibacillus sp. GCM10027628 TaxID=3273413 RepID=UPI00362EDD7A